MHNFKLGVQVVLIKRNDIDFDFIILILSFETFMEVKSAENEDQLNSQGEDVEQGLFGDDDDQQNLMDEAQGDVASSDSELQVQDPSQQMGQSQTGLKEEQEEDPMRQYYQKQNAILQWLSNNPGQKWVDKEFPTSSSQFYEDTAILPSWGVMFKNLEWRRPEQIIKDPKFMIIQEDKNGKVIDIDNKHGIFGVSHFISALSIVGTKISLLQKLIIEKEYFDKGFVSFQFFKNGKWVQVIVDTLLPYEKQQNNRLCVYSSCNNPQQFWIQLIEKAYIKLHRNYERISSINPFDILVDLTGGLSELIDLQSKNQKKQSNLLWNTLYTFLQQKFLLSAINSVEERGLKDAQQGQQGILENHYYTLMDMRDFPKDNLKLVRVRNPWGNQGVWTGPFCQEADDWQKYKAVKQDVKNAQKTKKSDGSWWMSFTDFIMQFDKVIVNKIFPESWQIYSIESQWTSKTNGGRSPVGFEKATGNQTKQVFKHVGDFSQPQSDDKWFNNPQFRLKVQKDTKIYISLMLEDQKLSNQNYISCGFMVAAAKSKSQRFWQRPPDADIIAQVNYHSNLPLQRQITQMFVLKKGQKSPGIYIIVPNINDIKQSFKKDQVRKFYMRLFTPDSIDVTQLPQTTQLSVQGTWTENSCGGSRKIQYKQDGKKKGEIRQNPGWCKNPQYFVSIKQPTLVKIILRKAGNKKYKGWKIGMTVARYEGVQEKKTQKQPKRQKKNAGHNLVRLIQQTSQFLKPPQLGDVQRKLQINTHEKFKQSMYVSEQCSALFFRWNPTEGPFIIIPSSDGQERVFSYKLTIFSNNPVQMIRLDETKNQVMIGRWQKDITAGGCHLNQKEKQPSQRTWSMNPKYLITFKQEQIAFDQPINLKITLAIAEKNWKKLNPNTVSGMIGLYLIEKRQGKLVYSPQIVFSQTSFLPVKTITLQTTIGGEKPICKGGYIIMPSTYESKVQGSFILSVKCDRPFDITQSK